MSEQSCLVDEHMSYVQTNAVNLADFVLKNLSLFLNSIHHFKHTKFLKEDENYYRK